jgi:NADH dehydrogenase
MKNLALNKKHIVLIGGGFAGLNFLKQMSGNKDYHITLIDNNNYNYFTPLLYQVATGFLEPSSISYPLQCVYLSSIGQICLNLVVNQGLTQSK